MPSRTLVSIVTINRNNAVGLERTIRSVQMQSHASWHHIVQDGGSSDGSLLLAKWFTDSRRVFRSEPDGGIYEGMNQGLGATEGELIWFLNSGDTLAHEDSLARVVESYVANGWEWAYGQIIAHSRSGGEYVYGRDGISPKRVLLGLETFPHPAAIFTSRIVSQLKKYRLEFGLAADQDFCLRAARIRRPSFIDFPLAVYAPGGASSHDGPLAHEMNFHRLRCLSGNPLLKSDFLDRIWAHAMAGARVSYSHIRGGLR